MREPRYKHAVWVLAAGIILVSVMVLLLALQGCGAPPEIGPTPTPSPTPTPAPSPTPVACAVPPSNDPRWQPLGVGYGPTLTQQIIDAEAVVGDVCGRDPEESLTRLAAQLQAFSLCSAKWADGVLVKNAAGLWEEYHAVAYGTGCWTNKGRYIGTWRYDQ